MASTSVIDELKKSQIIELLEQGKRIDGRALDEPREISIETNAIPKANGSARVFLGDTEVVCGVKIQPDRPFPDTGDKGLFIACRLLLAAAGRPSEPVLHRRRRPGQSGGVKASIVPPVCGCIDRAHPPMDWRIPTFGSLVRPGHPLGHITPNRRERPKPSPSSGVLRFKQGP